MGAGDRATLFYKDWGSSERVVAFVHGWPFNSDMWQYQMLGLASAGVRVVAYDQRRCGRCRLGTPVRLHTMERFGAPCSMLYRARHLPALNHPLHRRHSDTIASHVRE